MKTDIRIKLVRLLCVGVACSIGWPLLDISLPKKLPHLTKAVAQRVRVHAPTRKVVETKREQVIIRSTTAPKKPLNIKKQKFVEALLPPVALPETPVVELAPAAPAVPQLTLNQPGIPSAAPPAPPDELPGPAYFSDKPGGAVLVLAVQLNSDNIVIMTDIVVASNNPLNDLAFSFATRGLKWTEVNPPIPPGEYRWLEIRLDNEAQDNNPSVLP